MADSGGPTGNGWMGSEDCQGSVSTGGGPSQQLPSTDAITALSIAQASTTMTLTGVNLGPIAGLSCPDLTIVANITDEGGGTVQFQTGHVDCPDTAMVPSGSGGPVTWIASGVLSPPPLPSVLLLIAGQSNPQSSTVYSFSCTYGLQPH